MKSITLAAAVVAALSVSVPASVQAAEGFNVLLGGFGWRLPKCKEGKVLRETRDAQTGKLVWRCVLPQQQTADATTPRR
jgi:hypothetical protein